MRNDVTIYYDCWGASACDGKENAFNHLRELGITWVEYRPETIADMVKFFHCYNVPDELPDYIMVYDK